MKKKENKKILHVGSVDKFIPPFIDFINARFVPDEHQFLMSYGMATKEIKPSNNVAWFDRGLFNRAKFWLAFMLKVNSARGIIFHGLFDVGIIFMLAIQPWLWKKSYWAIWGGDLYAHKIARKTIIWHISEFFKKIIIPRMGHFVTHVQGDYKLACRWYGAKGEWHECFLYPSNLHKDCALSPSPHKGINILLGNSATQTNNHLDALERLRPFSNELAQIYCPLSYGDSAYADAVVKAGREIFGEKFTGLRNFMAPDQYLELLAKIDIAIFNHDRQQGMGNITTLLGLGKKVYMRSDLTSWGVFSKIGVKVYDISELNMTLPGENLARSNEQKVARYFSADNLFKSWKSVFAAN
ncbi:TDP-N-acetylfucosamine:lipid II N-acetylfucosaminyltransferase [Variovorax sp. VRV01]|uniref:TDP-N-acetylfucosamine:lipid II N-acetylfucosaminyltransferase n=1 Tax=Variovorax sp. VRV01 TaxID=2769259 RepID=UPI0017808978|nr:TDP-N-acetylfucosamine:lipid II N-acetylfucosaminyltransferase [Variovorax sp. VRV01]MBD9663191.1 TDP-N-acetylfucosamine:lipid II N-acetylfucosaminyltransferase [Variovorax sp. VRV01]